MRAARRQTAAQLYAIAIDFAAEIALERPAFVGAGDAVAADVEEEFVTRLASLVGDLDFPDARDLLRWRRGLRLRPRALWRGAEDFVQAARHFFVLARMHGHRADEEGVPFAFGMGHDARLSREQHAPDLTRREADLRR